jgi:hypothetical protein
MMERGKKTKTVQNSGKAEFFQKATMLIEQARAHVGRTADFAVCVTYFELGRMIVEQEQNGKERAEYGRSLLLELSEYLNGHFGKGFSETNLILIRIENEQERAFYEIEAANQQWTVRQLQRQKGKAT